VEADRAFSAQKHARSQWSSRVCTSALPLTRAAWHFLSGKRALVDRCAAAVAPGALALDIGCGDGAYSHWFLGRARRASVAAVDWSVDGLRRVAPSKRGRIMRVCADARLLPFKPAVFDAVFTVDTLGHVRRPEAMLDEIVRTAKPGAFCAVHSECCDYRERWPDRALIRALGRDVPAELDGHVSLRTSTELHHLYARRFTVAAFYSPAGRLGWLTGYPEKYRPAFAAARWRTPAVLCAVMSAVKRTPGPGLLLRLFNAATNHFELFLGLTGGGSCFAFLRAPSRAEPGVPPPIPGPHHD